MQLTCGTLADFHCLFFSPGAGKMPALLQFMTGLAAKPPLGFTPPLGIGFRHPEDLSELEKDTPYVNTCENKLKLPVMTDFERFKNIMHIAIFEIGCIFTDD